MPFSGKYAICAPPAIAPERIKPLKTENSNHFG
jgi:hypothetical protein